MTKEQEQLIFRKIDGEMLKCIPESAKWHMNHRPYYQGRPETVQGDGEGENEGKELHRLRI